MRDFPILPGFLEFHRVGGEVFLNHQGHLKHNGVLKLPQVQAGDLLDLLQAVDQGVAVDKQLPGSLGNVQVILKEPLDGEQGFLVQGLDGTALKDFLQEHIAQGGGQLINQTGNSQVVIADDGTLGVKYLTHFQGHLGLLKGTGQILNARHHGADTHHAVGVELAGKGVHNGAGQLVQVLGLNAGTDFLHQGDVRLVDVDDEILALIGEQVLHHIIGGNVRFVGNLNQHAHAAHVGIETELPGLEIDIAGQDVIQNHVLDKVAAVVLFIVILLDAAQGDSQQVCITGSFRVIAGNKDRISLTYFSVSEDSAHT